MRFKPREKFLSRNIFVLAFIFIVCFAYGLVTMIFVRVQQLDHVQERQQLLNDAVLGTKLPPSEIVVPEKTKDVISLATQSQDAFIAAPQDDEVRSVTCETSQGPITIVLDYASAPKGAAHLIKMVKADFFRDIPFFRVNKDITQFGVRPKSSDYHFKVDWERDLNVKTSLRVPWKRGVAAMIGGTQMVIVKRDSKLMGLNNHDTIVGRLSEEDMKVIDRLYKYNDIIDHPRGGPGPDQTKVYRLGWDYLKQEFPLVDKITSCRLDLVR